MLTDGERSEVAQVCRLAIVDGKCFYERRDYCNVNFDLLINSDPNLTKTEILTLKLTQTANPNLNPEKCK